MTDTVWAVFEEGKLRPLEPLNLEEGELVDISIKRTQTSDRPLAPSEILQLPADQRNRIVEAAMQKAEKLYRSDPSLTDFEAFGDSDLYDYPDVPSQR